MQRTQLLMAILFLVLSLLPSPSKGAQSAELEQLKARYKQVLAEIAELNKSGGNRSKMLTLINEMSSLQLSIQELELAGSKSPYDGMSVDELNNEMQKLMKEAQEATKSGDTKNATALWSRYAEVAKYYSFKANRAASGKMTAATRAGGGKESKLKYFTAMEAMRWMSSGQLERGINGYEAIVDNGINMMTAGTAIILAQAYFDFLSDGKRALVLIDRVIDYAHRAIGSGSFPLDDMNKRSNLMMLHGARNARTRFLAGLGDLATIEPFVKECEKEWKEIEERFIKVTSKPYDDMSFQFLFSGNFCLGAQLRFAAECCQAKGKDALAADYRKRAIDVYKHLLAVIGQTKANKTLMDTWDMTCKAMLARLIRDEEGDLAGLKAYEVYQEAENKWHKSQKIVAYGYYFLVTRLEYAEILMRLGRYDEAIAAARLADERFNAKDGSQEFAAYKALKWKPAYLLALIHEKKGDINGAIAEYIRSIEQIEELYAQMRSGKLKGQFLKMKECSESYRRLVKLLLKAGRDKEAFEYLERSKSAVLLDMLRSLPLRERKRWPKKLLEEERSLKKRMKEQKQKLEKDDSSSKTNEGKRSAVVQEATDNLQKARWEYEMLLRNIASHMATLASQENDNKFDKVWYQKATKVLDVTAQKPQNVLVEYFDDGKSLSCFVIKGKELSTLPCGSSQKIRKLVRKLRRHISSKSKRWKKSAKELYRALVKPWHDKLSDCASLYIVPTGYLHSLPFNCLINEKDELLVEEYPLAIISQASLLVSDKEQNVNGKGCLVFADPDGSLPNARKEAQDIERAVKEACTIRYGNDANEGWLKERLGFSTSPNGQPAILHLATHGLLEKGMDLFSSLVLSQSELEDGALTVGEVFNELDLRNTPVVVLSACNTALGAEGGGDEIVGLSRAFQYAGARWVVASLWEVSDEASAKLMKSFHEQLVKKDDGNASAALARAQRAILKTKEWKHPFYWAAFVPYRR